MRRLRPMLAALMMFITCMPSSAQTTSSASLDSQRFRELAHALEPAAFVSVRLTSGRRLTGTIVAVGDESFVFQRRARIPEPTREVRFDDVVALERARRGMNSGQKVLVGIGSSVGAFVLIMLVGAATISD
ncbi:MAG: hypothetical protein U0Q11_22865 [Vicinamibacterales bacterium]